MRLGHIGMRGRVHQSKCGLENVRGVRDDSTAESLVEVGGK